MSKINALQAEALKAPVSNTPAASDTATKAPAPKAKPAKAAASKTSAAVETASKKAVKTKAAKPEKAPKLKMERDSFTMPKTEYAQLSVLKERLAKLGQPVKKSELLRAGIMQLTAMTDTALKAAMSKVPTIKTGRPKK